jgi:hypothetical protein
MATARKSRWARVAACAVAGSLLALLASEVLTPSDGQQSQASASVAPTSNFGLYVGSGDPSGVASFGQAMGAQPAYAMDFLDGSSWQSIDNPWWWTDQWQGSGYTMIWGVPILPNDTSYSLAQGAAGDYNQYFVTLAQSFVAEGQGSSILRLGWEFNGGWYPWNANGQAANFIGYWQQIVTAMRSVPGANFKFEWNPTLGDQGVGNLADYYPGNAYVDYIGADVYDQQWQNYPGAAAEFTQLETENYGLDWLASFAGQEGKQITIPEWGLGEGPGNAGAPITASNQEASGGDDPTFINDMAHWMSTNNVFESTYFDFSSSALSPTVDPNSYAALINDFGESAASSPSTPTSTTTTTAPPAPPTTTTTTTAPPAPSTTTTTTAAAPTVIPTATTVAANERSAKYGSEDTTKFTVMVSPSESGSATVLSGGSTLCTAVITNGGGSCSLSNSQLGLGIHGVDAQFSGGPNVGGSASSQILYVVRPAWG